MDAETPANVQGWDVRTVICSAPTHPKGADAVVGFLARGEAGYWEAVPPAFAVASRSFATRGPTETVAQTVKSPSGAYSRIRLQCPSCHGATVELRVDEPRARAALDRIATAYTTRIPLRVLALSASRGLL